MTGVLRARELEILTFYAAKQCSSPDVFSKGSMLFPDQPRHIVFYIHLSLFHIRGMKISTNWHQSWPVSVFCKMSMTELGLWSHGMLFSVVTVVHF
jgi:hypothetical protein